MRDCLKSPNRPQIEALRAGKTGQKCYSLAIIGAQITVETPSQLLFRRSLLEGQFPRRPLLGSSVNRGNTSPSTLGQASLGKETFIAGVSVDSLVGGSCANSHAIQTQLITCALD